MFTFDFYMVREKNNVYMCVFINIYYYITLIIAYITARERMNKSGKMLTFQKLKGELGFLHYPTSISLKFFKKNFKAYYNIFCQLSLLCCPYVELNRWTTDLNYYSSMQKNKKAKFLCHNMYLTQCHQSHDKIFQAVCTNVDN